jgi:hypothetical protein
MPTTWAARSGPAQPGYSLCIPLLGLLGRKILPHMMSKPLSPVVGKVSSLTKSPDRLVDRTAAGKGEASSAQGEDGADVGAGTRAGIGVGGAACQVAERGAHRGELGQSPVDVGQVLVDEAGDVGAGGVAAVA